MNMTPEQPFTKIGILVMENDLLRAELSKCQQEKAQDDKKPIEKAKSV